MRWLRAVALIVGIIVVLAAAIGCYNTLNRQSNRPEVTLNVTNLGAFPVRIYEHGSYRRLGVAYPGITCITFPRWLQNSNNVRLRFNSLGTEFDVASDIISMEHSWEITFSINENMRVWDALSLVPAIQCRD